MKRAELLEALEDLQKHLDSGSLSHEEFEAAKLLLHAHGESESKRRVAKVDPHKTAPYPSLPPELVEMYRNNKAEIDPHPTPYQAPISTSQYVMTTPPPPTAHPSSPAPSSRLLGTRGSIAPSPTPAPPTAPSSPALGELVEALKEISELHKLGVLSDQEFESTKTPILQKMRGVFRVSLEGKREHNSLSAALLELFSK